MKLLDNILVECHEIDFLGHGVCKYQDLVIFVPGLINGEKAVIKITERKKKFAYGVILKIVTPSTERRDIQKVNLGSTPLIHLKDHAQESWQIATTINTFKKISGNQITVDSIIKSPKSLYYRNKAVFHVMDKEFITLGVYDINQKLVRTDHFLLADELINKFLRIINDAKFIRESDLLQIVMRSNDKQILLTFVVTKKDFYGKDLMIRILSRYHELIGITINVKKKDTEILSDESYTIWGQNTLDFNLRDLTLKVNDLSFYQINTSIIEPLYEKIVTYIDSNASVVDAYCGVGSIGLFLANKKRCVHLIDINNSNFYNIKENIMINNLTNIYTYHGSVEQHLNKISADVLIVDPPRFGLTDSVISIVNEKKFQKIIYLSCDLKSLVKNIVALSNYEIEHISSVRMFPQTVSIETLVVLKFKII